MNTQTEKIVEKLYNALKELGLVISRPIRRRGYNERHIYQTAIPGLCWVSVSHLSNEWRKGFFVLVGILQTSGLGSELKKHGFQEYFPIGMTRGQLWYSKELNILDALNTKPKNERQEVIKETLSKLRTELENIAQIKRKRLKDSKVTKSTLTKSNIYAYVITDKDKEDINQSQYSDRVKHKDKYDVFIDGCSMQASKKTSETNPLIKNTLNPTGFALLKEYIGNPHPMSLLSAHTKIPDRLKKDELTALKYFQEARRMVDFSEGRYRWKCFKNISGKAENTVFQFSPPPKYKYCLIVPVNWDKPVR